MNPNQPDKSRHLPPAAARIAVAVVLLSLASGLRAQTAATDTTGQQPVMLSRFEVSTTTDNSYSVDSATSGLKTQQQLLDIPTPVQVMPRTVIDDLGFDWLTTDYARYVSSGLNSYGGNNVVYLRGQKWSWMFKDGLQYFPSVDDDFGVETIEVVKGINSSLFGSLPSISGMVLLTTKVPLPVQRDSIRLMATTGSTGGVLRAEVDSTGPLSKELLGAKVSYRLLLMDQDGDKKQIYDDSRLLVSPSVQFDWKRVTLRVRYEYSDITDFGLYTNNFLDANNQVSTIGGRDQTYKAPWSNSEFKKGEFEVNLINRYTDDFQSKLQIAYYQELRTDHDNRAFLVAAPGGKSLNGNAIIPVTPQSTLASTVLQLNQNQYTVAVNDDFVANYDILNHSQQTNFGFSSNYLYNSQGLVQPYLGSISVINPIFPADPGAIAIPGSATTIAVTTVGFLYLQHQANFFSDRFVLTAGANWGFNDTTSHKAVAAPTYLESKGNALTYKIAGIYKITPLLSFYASHATAFVPQSPGIADQNGQPLPSISSKDDEIGFKTNRLFNGMLTGSVGYYNSTTLNQSVVINPGTANTYYANSGQTTTHGLEFDLTLNPVKDWTIVGTLFEGAGVVSSVTGTYANRTYKHTGSLLTKYDFTSGVLKGFAIGGTMFYQGVVYVRPAPAYPAWTIYGLFATYTTGRFQIAVNVNNLTNTLYDAGGNSRLQVDIGQPRTYGFSVKYSF